MESQSFTDDFTSLLPKLTLKEKVTLLSGQDFSTIAGLPQYGIPPINVADSTSGINPSGLDTTKTTAVFPNTVCYASTWDAELLHRVGTHLAAQARMKGVQVVLGPSINIHRDPRAGRNFECFSEDPLLSGQLAAALVNGLRSRGVGSCPKHFVCNDSETLRRYHDVREKIDGRAVREIYLAAWQHLLRWSDPDSVMMAYNKVDGHFCSQSNDLMELVLRREWGFKGIIMSDWFGTHATVEPVKAGLDIEMPFPVFRGDKLVEAVKAGEVTEDEVDAMVTRALELRNRTRSCLGSIAEKSEIDEETNKLAREVAASGMVLLKNDNDALPINASKSRRVAFIGEYAAEPVITGGGSASCVPQYRISPAEVLQERLPGAIQQAPGVQTRRIIPVTPSTKLRSRSGAPGVDIGYFNKGASEPALKECQAEASVWTPGNFHKEGVNPVGSRLEMSTKLTPETSGEHTLAVRCTGAFHLSVNGKEVLSGDAPNVTTEQFIFNHILLQSRVQVPMEAGASYNIHLNMDGPRELTVGEPTPYAATICFEEQYSEDAAIAEAVEIARSSDAAIVYAGRDGQYESEGFDLDDIRMPENQARLIKAVAAVAQKTILVLHCGNPIDVSAFVDDVDAVLLAHFSGQEGANAAVDLLLGDASPSGRLATTWFKTLEDYPSYGNFPCETPDEGDPYLVYAEGLAVGYRAPGREDRIRWPFGHGLSYTTFSYSNPKAQVEEFPGKGTLRCSVEVQNSGPVAGKEVVQLFVRPPTQTRLWRPERELKGFAKVSLGAGEARRVDIDVDLFVACSYWDELDRAWRLEAGAYEAVVGGQQVGFMVLGL